MEIGPSHNPIAPKREGWDTCIVDHTTRAGLIEKYEYSDARAAVVESVDVVWSGGALHEQIPRTHYGTFDAIIASHVLEHMPDPLGFLVSCQIILRPGGRVVLALPDKRRCFDFFGGLTTAGDWIENHLNGRNTHTPRTAWNEVAYAVRNDGAIGWGSGGIGELSFLHSLSRAMGCTLRSAHRTSEYFDHHAWRFVPASFALIILELGAVDYLHLHIRHLSDVEQHEFFVDLVNDSESTMMDDTQLNMERLRLLKAAISELSLQYCELVAGKAL
jgi:SAM-dependent methyltransferase